MKKYSVLLCLRNALAWTTFFLMLVLLRRSFFWPPSMVYISINRYTYILQITILVGPLFIYVYSALQLIHTYPKRNGEGDTNKNYTKTTSMRCKVGKTKVVSTISASKPPRLDLKVRNVCLQKNHIFKAFVRTIYPIFDQTKVANFLAYFYQGFLSCLMSHLQNLLSRLSTLRLLCVYVH